MVEQKKENMIVQYVRYPNKQPFGVVVATSKDNIGFSLCSPLDKWDRDKAKLIAMGRARKVNVILEFNKLYNPNSFQLNTLKYIINRVIARANAYYK